MNYEYWLDVIQFFDDIADRMIKYGVLVLKKMHEQGTIIQIGDLDINKIFNEIKNEKDS